MSISSVGGASALSQLYSVQQAQALSAVSVDVPSDGTLETSASQASGGNALTGTTTSNLDSQTLQALLELTQQAPEGSTSDPSQAAQTGQAQGAHRHHHHHGGGMMQAQAQPGDPSQSSTAVATGGATAEADDGAADASLEQVLTTV